MQETRLNQLLNNAGDRATQWANNPWRRLSLVLLALLFGFFLANGIATTAGQLAYWDVSLSALCVVLIEIVNRLAYGLSRQRTRPGVLWGDILNALKLGFIYGFILEAFKLGS
ncbi:DUF565 domain-containing protein [Spirulina sp. CCNP1310]|uniref:DUF565 domain-containing protein n=1 Tax=Spirulina sp. CCNP1310 TaxID=3110249 RepID=UPI002B1F58A4|nr:DUF565 domain-containing protein [Spirulina sp. CCNP1310]MEA5420561.1 DUF565 domain-containing protein [Spirulina sp. CCNP1310]